MVVFNFSVLDRKYPFWANLVWKIKIFSLERNLVSSLTRICKIQWWCLFYWFRLETACLDKFGPKNQNCHFKLKFCTKFYFNMQNSMAIFSFFFCLRREIPFLGKFGPKTKIVSLGRNLMLWPIRKCRSPWCCSLFLFSTRNTLFGQICDEHLAQFCT